MSYVDDYTMDNDYDDETSLSYTASPSVPSRRVRLQLAGVSLSFASAESSLC